MSCTGCMESVHDFVRRLAMHTTPSCAMTRRAATILTMSFLLTLSTNAATAQTNNPFRSLESKRVSFATREQSLSELAAALNKQTGYSIVIDDQPLYRYAESRNAPIE